MAKLITFSGLDGSGKSTLIAATVEAHPDFKQTHIIHFRLINRLLGRSGGGSSGPRKSGTGNPLVGLVNLDLLVLDIIIFNIYSRFARRTIVSDRYFYDLVATHIYRYGQSGLARLALRLARTPDLAIFVEVAPEVAHKREQGDNHDVTYFTKLHAIHEKLTKSRPNVKIVENKSIEEATSQTLELVTELVGEKDD